jgi:hypothetical protein
MGMGPRYQTENISKPRPQKGSIFMALAGLAEEGRGPSLQRRALVALDTD